jgi:long-chain acyl-CoA synthetase
VVTIGDGRKYLAALVAPRFDTLEAYARDHAIPFASRTELVHRPEVVDLFRAQIEKASEDLAPYERIQRFTLLDHELTQDGGELTPTQKVKRKAIAAKYADVIEQMYRSPSR